MTLNIKQVKLSKIYTIKFQSYFIDWQCIRLLGLYIFHSPKVCPLYSSFPSPKTKLRHLSLSLVSSSVSPWFIMLRLTPSIHRSLDLPLLRVPSGSHSKTFSGSLFPGILFTWYIWLNIVSQFRGICKIVMVKTEPIKFGKYYWYFCINKMYRCGICNPRSCNYIAILVLSHVRCLCLVVCSLPRSLSSFVT
jgi:hypothetical protein